MSIKNLNTYKLPRVEIKSQNVEDKSAISLTTPAVLDVSSVEKIKNTQLFKNISVASNLYQEQPVHLSSMNNAKEYFDRGINILKPEIIMSSEFVPIIKSHQEEPGLQIQTGSSKISTNQILKLIELHAAVQKSVNLNSASFTSEASGIPNIERMYLKIRRKFKEEYYETSLAVTVENFKQDLKAILGNTEFGADGANFETIINSGKKIQIETVERILEIVVLEDITISLLNYFRKIINLKEVIIPQYLDILSIKRGSSINDGVNPSFDRQSKIFINLLKNNYHNGNFNFFGIDSDKNAFSFLAKHEIIQKTLGFKSVSKEVGNYEVIYATLINIFKTLNFKNFSFYPSDILDRNAAKKLEEEIQDVSNSYDSKLHSNIQTFINHVNVSSFLIGNITQLNTNNFYTTYALNEKTKQRNLNCYLNESLVIPGTNESIQSFLLKNSAEPLANSLNKSIDLSRGHVNNFLNSFSDFTSNNFVGELMNASIYDVVYGINQKLINTDSFSENFSSLQRYEKNILGKSFGLSLPPVVTELMPNATGNDKILIGSNVDYESDLSHDLNHKLGKIGNELFKTKQILNEKVSVLPGSNKSYLNLNKTLTGISGISLEAFTDFNVDSLKSYNKNIQNFLNKNLTDINKLFGFLDGNSTPTKVSTDEVFDNIILNFSQSIEKLLSNLTPSKVDAEYTDDDFCLALNILLMITAGKNDDVLCSLFTSFFLRSHTAGGFFSRSEDDPGQKSNNALDSFSKDASMKVLRIFFGLLSKELQRPGSVAKQSTHNQDIDLLNIGNYANANFTFINNTNFNGSMHFLGKQLESDDFSKKDKIGFRSANTKDELLEDFIKVLIEKYDNPCIEPVNYFNKLARTVVGYDADSASDVFGSLDTQITAPDPITETEQFNLGAGQNGETSLRPIDEPTFFINYLKGVYEKPNKFNIDNSLLGTSQVHREFSVFTFLCRLLSETLTAKVTFNKAQKKFYITYSKTELLALLDCLKGKERNNDDLNDYRSISAYDYRKVKNKTKSSYSALTKPFYERSNKIKRSYGILYGHLNNLFELEQKISSVLNENALAKKEKIALEYYGLKSINRKLNRKNKRSDENHIFGDDSSTINPFVKKSFLNFLNSNSYATIFKNYIDNVCQSKDSLLFSPKESCTNSQVYQMTLAMSPKNYGMTSKEKFGKKTILSVGLPPNLVTQLGIEGQIKNNDNDYFNSPYICIHVFKKDAIGGNILYYPKPFIFNTRLENFENFNLGQLGSVEDPNHETNASSINSFQKLLEEYSLYKYDIADVVNTSTTGMIRVEDYNDMLIEPDDLNYINSSGIGSRQDTLKEMKTNHMMNFYLGLYRRLTTGIDISENVFPIYSTNRRSRNVDDRVKDLYASYRDQLFLKYPSINVDKILAREFLRLENNIGASRLFSLDQRTKNIFASKSFEKIFNVYINEADFVAYPYPDNITLDAGNFNPGSSFVDSLTTLYGEATCPYFSLDSKNQIKGINSTTKNGILVQNTALTPNQQFANLSYQDMINTLAGKQKQFYKHMNEIESENVADVYEFFTVVSVIRRK
jgi:hypothetical protein